MKKQKKSGCMIWVIIAGVFVALALVYGLFIQPLQSVRRVIRDAIPTATAAATATPTPDPVTAALTERPTPTPTFTPAPTNTPTPQPTDPPMLKQGSKGEDVRRIQSELIRLGYLSGTADGDFGRNTAQAVKDFQICNGLSEDGIFGAECWVRMFSSYNVTAQRTVYVSSRNVYHTDEHCSGMKSSTKMKLSDAIRKGYSGHRCH